MKTKDEDKTRALWDLYSLELPELPLYLNIPSPLHYRLKPDTVRCWAVFLASKYEVSVSSSG